MKKEIRERQMQAKERYKENKSRFSGIIQTSARDSVIYDHLFEKVDNNSSIDGIKLMKTDTVSALSALVDTTKMDANKIAVLNFASALNPGGAFMGGSMAQEEALCHESTLYNVLEMKPDFYEKNKEEQRKGLYKSRAIFSPSILFFTKTGNIVTNVITCAAPNKRRALDEKVPKAMIDMAMDMRISFMYDIAKKQDIKTLILGAWGCGVFGNDPHTVCRLLVKRRPEGMNVIFAIPDQENFDAFAEEMHKTDIPVKQTIRSFVKSHGWQMECPLIPMAGVMTVHVNFMNNENVEDETSFDVKAYDVNELAKLFMDFCHENGYQTNSVTGVSIVDLAKTMDEIEKNNL